MAEDKLIKLIEELSPKEREILLKQLGGHNPAEVPKVDLNLSTRHEKAGFFSDPHVGEENFKEYLWHKMCQHFIKNKIEIVYCAGDNLEGMSGRDGQIYNLKDIGFSSQIKHLEQLITAYPKLQFYAIDGNHDEWYKIRNNGGLVVGEELAQRCKNWHFLGCMEADVKLTPKATLKLYHGRDGTAYADSYKLQKLIESFTGGEKPNVVLSGHYHKYVVIERRNVIGIEAGTLCGQSSWMRGKKIPAHCGYGIIDMYFNKKGLDRVKHEWVPDYD